jgi:hypothetical protein
MDPSVSYRHLDSKLRLGELTFGQWGCVAAGVLAAIGYALYLHPFGAYLTLATAVYLAGIPALLALIASLYEVRLGLIARSIVRHLREEGRYLPGPGEDSHGYVLLAAESPDGDVAASAPSFEAESLWER